MHNTLMVTKMKFFNLDSMKRGWFVGNFEPSVYKTEEFEVAVKRYEKGEHEKSHYHKIAYEITLVIEGMILMNNKKFDQGDIIILDPGESCEFKCLTEKATTVVVKTASIIDDKYINIDKSNEKSLEK